jgi:hypothetical protein
MYQSMLKGVLAVFHQLFETSKRFSITVRIRKDNLQKKSHINSGVSLHYTVFIAEKIIPDSNNIHFFFYTIR